MGTSMIAIQNTLVSEELIEEKFVCDINICRGGCWVEGDSGAPLEKGEEEELKKIYDSVKHYMTPEGRTTIEKKGFSIVDEDGDDTIPLVEGGKKQYCSFVHFEKNGIAKCSIEKVYYEGGVSFKKPMSCHL